MPYRNSKGKLHRTDGPAVIWPDGTLAWHLNGKLHRIGGPAREHTNGTKYWYVNGRNHRTDGPAIEWHDGTDNWWVNGLRMYNRKLFQEKSGISDEEMVMLILKYGEIA